MGYLYDIYKGEGLTEMGKEYKYVAGLDIALSTTGIAIVNYETEELIFADKIVTKKKDYKSLEERIQAILHSIMQTVNTYDAKLSGIENGFVGANRWSSLELTQLRGAVAGVLGYENRETSNIPPKEIRLYLVNNGGADKEEVAEYIVNLYGEDHPVIKSIGPYSDKQNKKKTSDIYDAIGIALACIRKKKAENEKEQ